MKDENKNQPVQPTAGKSRKTAQLPTQPGHVQQICYLAGEEQSINPLDMAVQNCIAKMTGGISPASVSLAWLDWGIHLAVSPGKQADLLGLLQKQALEWPQMINPAEADEMNVTDAASADSRFSDQRWKQWPYRAMSAYFLQTPGTVATGNHTSTWR